MNSADKDAIMRTLNANVKEVLISGNRKVDTIAMIQTAPSGMVRPIRLFVLNPPNNMDTYAFEDNGSYYESDFLSLEILGRLTVGCTSQKFTVYDQMAMPYEIDLQAKQQKNIVTGTVRPILKIDNSCNGGTSTIEEQADDVPIQDEEDVPDELRCPITSLPFKHPVIAPDGHTYERDALARWLKKKYSSPLHGTPMPPGNIIPDVSVSMALSKFRLTRPV